MRLSPIGASTLLSAKIVKGAKLKVYPGASHGLCTTHKNEVNEDLPTFITD
jgi:non-heme chloroperoxidase